MSNDENTTELPENLEQALKNVLDASDLNDAMEAFAVLKKADDPSHQKILADRLEALALEFLSDAKEIMDELPAADDYTPAGLTGVFMAESAERGSVLTQKDFNEGIASVQLLAQIVHYVSEHKQDEALDSSLKSFIDAISGLSTEEYNDFKMLFGTMLISVRNASVPAHAENPFGNDSIRP